MRIDREDLRRHYASLPDGALLALERSELTEAAKAVYDEELVQRNLTSEEDDAGELDPAGAPAPDWIEDATCACAFTLRSPKSHVPMATQATTVLKAAGIPCHVLMNQEEPPNVDPAPQYSLRLMVPGGLALHAHSLLDQHIFNEEQENEWRAALEILPDEELLALNPEVFCAGLLDRIARLKKAYAEEVAQRNLTPEL
jgi:hypothetical protein